jgi:hypothetical protein
MSIIAYTAPLMFLLNIVFDVPINETITLIGLGMLLSMDLHFLPIINNNVFYYY